MAQFKGHRNIITPVRQVTLAICVATVIFVVTKERPTLEQSISTLYRHPSYSPSQIIQVSDVGARADPNAAADAGPVAAADASAVVAADASAVVAPDAGAVVAPDAGAVADTRPCLKYIFYDKPVKTGSTAVTEALKRYLKVISEPLAPCSGVEDCTRVGQEVCVGTVPRGHLIYHVRLNGSVTACLRDKGFYHVTSIREPKERIISAWRFSLTKKTNHYGIPYNSTFDEFLRKFPRCALYKYYDGIPSRCSYEEALERAEKIANRFDEVIDLSDSPIGDVHKRIQRFLREENVAPSGRATTGEKRVPDEVSEIEYLLYNKLKEKRVTLAERPRRVLCER